jgi:LPXTG-motif cell wall-anchored protein
MKKKFLIGFALLMVLAIALIPAAALASSTLDDAPPDILDGEEAPPDIIDEPSPSTGDETNLLLYGGIALFAVVAAGSFMAISKKRKASSN